MPPSPCQLCFYRYNQPMPWLDQKYSWRLAGWVALTALFIVPIWIVPIVPMQDVYEHLALVDVIHRYNDPATLYKQYFLLPHGLKPNLVYYYFTDLLDYPFSLLTAHRIVLSLYVILFTAGFYSLVRAFGRSPYIALLGFLLVYNQMFAYGFVSFFLGIPVLFFTLAAYERFMEAWDRDRFDWRQWSIVALLTVFSFFVHAHIYLLIGLLGLAMAGAHRKGWRRTVIALTPFMPSLVVFLPWFVTYFVLGRKSTSGMRFASVENGFGARYYPLYKVFARAYNYVTNYFRDYSDEILFGLGTLGFLGLLMTRETDRKNKDRVLITMVIVLGISLLVLPQHIKAQSIVAPRHTLFLVVFLFLLADFNPRKRLAVVSLNLVLIAAILVSVNTMTHFIRFNNYIGDYPAIFKYTKPKKRLIHVASNSSDPITTIGALWYLHMFYMYKKGGVTDVQFAQYPHNPIQYRKGMKVPTPPIRSFYRSPSTLTFDYLLMRKSAWVNLHHLKSHVVWLGENKDWTLFRILRGPPARVETRSRPWPRRGAVTYK